MGAFIYDSKSTHTHTIKGHKEGKKEPKTKGKGKHNVGNVVVQTYPQHVYRFIKTWPVGFKISKHRVKFKSVDKLYKINWKINCCSQDF